MREIKFRGRHIKSAVRNSRIAPCEMVFGGYAVLLGAPHIIFDGTAWQVEPESVQQLIGVDKNGNEVYEGDLVDLLEYNCLLPPTEATFAHYAGILDGEIIGHISED